MKNLFARHKKSKNILRKKALKQNQKEKMESGEISQAIAKCQVLSILNKGKESPYAFDCKELKFVKFKTIKWDKIMFSRIMEENYDGREYRICTTEDEYMFVIPKNFYDDLVRAREGEENILSKRPSATEIPADYSSDI
jgi:hypothetical protein